MVEAGEGLVIRPDPRRHRGQALTGGPVALIAVAVLSVRLADEFGWLAAPAMAGLIAPPALAVLGYLYRHHRTVTLAGTGTSTGTSTGTGTGTGTGTTLRLTDWRGRQWTLRRPTSVCYCTLYSGGGRMEHVVVAGALTERPLVLRTRQWRPADLEQMWRRLGLEPEIDDLTSVRGVRFRFPGAPLPYPTRHPMTVGALVTGATSGHIWLVLTLVRAAAG